MIIPRYGVAVLGPALAVALFVGGYVCNLSAQVKPEAFRRTIDGSQVDLYTWFDGINAAGRSRRAESP